MMPARAKSSDIRPQRLWPVALALLAIGCGLSDYEKRIDEQKKKLDRLSQEGKVLGEPLAFPPNRLNEKKEPALALPIWKNSAPSR